VISKNKILANRQAHATKMNQYWFIICLEWLPPSGYRLETLWCTHGQTVRQSLVSLHSRIMWTIQDIVINAPINRSKFCKFLNSRVVWSPLQKCITLHMFSGTKGSISTWASHANHSFTTSLKVQAIGNPLEIMTTA